MVLTPGFLSVALQLQETATKLSHSDIRTRLSDELSDKMRGTGNYGYINDIFGDDESGDVIYYYNGDLKKASYSMGTGADGKPMCSIDCENAKDVIPVTTYQEESDETDDGDHVASMEAAKLFLPETDIRLIERFVSKTERAAMPKEDFAGKGTSFPIKTAQDVKDAARSIGRAGTGNLSMKAIKKNIIDIAKRKGFTSSLPKAWQESGTAKVATEAATESAATEDSLRLVESAAPLEPIKVAEARADYEIKLIAPGAGSTAYYTPEVLQRDGPKVFTKETKVYLNHQTAAQEKAQPEGRVEDLAGVLTTDAEYRESHAKGPGLYARMKVFADHAQMVEEKAPHIGMSIRANGTGVKEAGKWVTRDGVPLLASLTSRKSVDVVTEAGAGGMILTESASNGTAAATENAARQTQEVSAMDAEEIKLLKESVAANTAISQKLLNAEMRREAIKEAAHVLRDVSLQPAAKEYIIANVLREALPVKDGALDTVKLTEAINAEAKRYGSSLPGGARVTGMGVASLTEAKKAKECATCKGEGEDADGEDCPDCNGTGKVKESRARMRETKREEADNVALFESLGLNKDQAAAAARGRVQ